MASEQTPDLALDTRSGLPDALRVLLESYPREGWQSDPGFDGLVRFWLERHLMFRELLEMLRTEAEGRLDNQVEAQVYRHRLSRLGSTFVQGLHAHHSIEDHHFFPVLATRDVRLEHGFQLLDSDHNALDAVLTGFAEDANAAIATLMEGEGRDSVALVLAAVERAERLINRHLTDEEELIVPVILKYGTDGLPG